MSVLRPLLCIVMAAAVCGCDRLALSGEAPLVNPNPQRSVRVSGSVDPSLSIKVSAVYVSTERECRRVTNWFAGASAPLSERVESSVSRSGTAYEALVSLDHLLEGKCRWRPYAIEFQIATQDGLSTGSFATVGNVTRHVAAPVSVIWIDARKGVPPPLPLVRECRRMHRGEAAGLLCVPPVRGNVTTLSEAATEVQVDFRDLTGSQ